MLWKLGVQPGLASGKTPHVLVFQSVLIRPIDYQTGCSKCSDSADSVFRIRSPPTYDMELIVSYGHLASRLHVYLWNFPTEERLESHSIKESFGGRWIPYLARKIHRPLMGFLLRSAFKDDVTHQFSETLFPVLHIPCQDGTLSGR